MSEKTTHITFNTADSLDDLLNDILKQLKEVKGGEKENISYLKLMELFFKGMDLREKMAISYRADICRPQFNIITGIELDKI